MKVYLFDILLGRVYKKIPEATYTYIYCTSVKDYLLNLLGNVEVADLIASHVTQLTTLLSEPASRLIKPIEIDYNFMEVVDQYLFDNAGKRFIKESGSLKGSPQAFIRYEYSESKKPNPAPFIEGTYFHFAIFLDSDKLISNLKEGPKGFCLEPSIYCLDQNLYYILLRLISHRLTPCHLLSHLIPLVRRKTNFIWQLLKVFPDPNLLITTFHPFSHLFTPYHTLSPRLETKPFDAGNF